VWKASNLSSSKDIELLLEMMFATFLAMPTQTAILTKDRQRLF
jgi:hypothetical protein